MQSFCKPWVVLLLSLLLLCGNARAHQANDSWLAFSLSDHQIAGQWDLSVSDLDTALGLDDNDDGAVSLEELQTHHDAIVGFVLPHLQVKTDGVSRKIRVTGQKLTTHLNGVYVGLMLALDDGFTNNPETFEVKCDLFYDLNPKFLNRVSVDRNGEQRTINLTMETPMQVFDFSRGTTGHQLLIFFREGVWHIWTGFDHILFLLALLLPSVLWRKDATWQPVNEFRKALIAVLKIVTAFTVAHSLTLSLAALGVIRLPSRLTESTIAASVVLAALNNIYPLVTRREWMVAFGFGLIHGFGFASGLSDMGIARGNLAVTVLGFNLGVEAGQLAIVSVFFPVAYALRKTWMYPRIILRAGSCVIALIAAVWLVERVFNLKLLPF